MWLALWDDASMDATGLFARSEKLAGTIEKVRILLGLPILSVFCYLQLTVIA